MTQRRGPFLTMNPSQAKNLAPADLLAEAQRLFQQPASRVAGLRLHTADVLLLSRTTLPEKSTFAIAVTVPSEQKTLCDWDLPPVNSRWFPRILNSLTVGLVTVSSVQLKAHVGFCM
jgi:hypothetical protein